MSLFGNIDTQGVEEAQDVLGGGGSFIKETDVYPAVVKVAYVTEATSGAMAVNFEFELEDGSNYRETIYSTNRNKQVFFEKDGKKIPLPGFTTVNNICLMTTEKEMVAQDSEMKTLMVYDFESRKDIPKELPVLVDLCGKPVLLAIQKVRENKTTKNDQGKYVPTNEERILNQIAAVFHPETKQTISEAMAGRDAEFMEKWLAKNQGETYDKFKEVSNSSGSRRPTSTAGTKTDAPARTSMFAKK